MTKKHEFQSGYTRPFRANCTKCGKTKQAKIHNVAVSKPATISFLQDSFDWGDDVI